MTKKDRQTIFNKYGGRCAYTGKPLGTDWQVDHITPQCNFRWGLQEEADKDCPDNLLPALRIVNHYKRGKDLELFRDFMLRFHIRLARLPKTTKRAKTTKRKAYMMTVAEHFEIAADKPFSGIFYFETIQS